jgi:hypothetical protein
MIGTRYVLRNEGKLLRVAAVAALVALVLMIWSFHDTSPIVLVGFMVIGQSLGTLSLVVYLVVVLVDVFADELGPKQPPGAPAADGETPPSQVRP